MRTRSPMLINSEIANNEINKRPKRSIRPPKLDEYYLEPVVKHKRCEKVKEHNIAPLIIRGSSNGISNCDVGVGFNDELCNLCGKGGNLVLCDSCPSSFHKTCHEIQTLPLGKWHCAYCLCKFCGAFQLRSALNSEMIKCSLCERKFHKSCANGSDIDLGDLPLCGRECHGVYEKLQKYLGLKIDLQDDFTCTLVKRYDLGPYSTSFRRKCNNKLATALKIFMNECFKRSVDSITRTNMIKNVVFNKGSKFRRLDFSGFFTAILEKGGDMISVASIRIHGNQIAEMPYIGTSIRHRHKGMCSRLLDSIETILWDVGVRKLVIPAARTLEPVWIKTFGFTELEKSTMKTMKSMSIVIFPNLKILQKHLQNRNDNLRQIKGSFV